MNASTDVWQTILLAFVSPAVIGSVIIGFQNWRTRRAAKPREDATASATMLDAQGRENRRLSDRNDQLESRIATLETRAEESDARERLLQEALHRFTVWATQAVEVAHRNNIELPPPPKSPLS